MTYRFYNMVWQIMQPFLGMQLRRRAKLGKEDSLRLSERYGSNYKTQRPEGKLIWLHAVSVGESVAAISLVRALKTLDDDLKFLITTNTITAAARIADTPATLSIEHVYQPLDHPKWVRRFLRYWRPDSAIFLESDFWPNLICETSAADIPVYFASSQLSDGALQRWLKRPVLAAQIFGAARKIFAVDDIQTQAFKKLSGHAGYTNNLTSECNYISSAGSLKLDLDQLTPNPAYVKALKRWKQQSNRPILLFASSHDGEEARLMACLNNMVESETPLLIIAPRHPDRGDHIAQQFLCQKRLSQNALPDASDKIFLADTLGDMGSLFAAADIILLGGSFIDIGGHNPLEPASFGKPIITGPSHFKNIAACEALAKAGSLKLLADMDELPAALKDWQGETMRLAAGMKGQKIADMAAQAPLHVAKAIFADLRAQERL